MSEKRECERTGCVVGAISDRIGGLGGGGIPGIAGPGTQRGAGDLLAADSVPTEEDGAATITTGLEATLNLGILGLVGRASYGPAAARSGREPVEPNSEERHRRAAWQ